MAVGIFTSDGAALLLGWLLGNTVTQPLSLEARLYSTTGTRSSSGTELPAGSGPGATYNPQPIAFNEAVDIGSNVIQAATTSNLTWASLNSTSSVNLNSMEIWDADNDVRLAYFQFPYTLVVTAGQPFSLLAGNVKLTWDTTAGDQYIDINWRIPALNWLVGYVETQPVAPLNIRPVEPDGDYLTEATEHDGDLWTEEEIEFSTPLYNSGTGYVESVSEVFYFDGLDVSAALALEAVELVDASDPESRIGIFYSLDHPDNPIDIVDGGESIKATLTLSL